jgi:signal peptidase I
MSTQAEGVTRARHIIIEMVRTAVQVLVLFLLISAVIGRFEIHQISMEPNFHEGQRVIVSKLNRIWDTLLVQTAHAAAPGSSPFAPGRGEVVVFYPPNGSGDALIKRVIGVPGDTIELRDNLVYVNGQLLDEPYINGQPTYCNNYCKPLKLEAGMFFMMGDNRPSSLDSRNFGPVPSDRLIGRVVMRYWPLDQLQIYP